MLSQAAAAEISEAHRRFERARSGVWLRRIRAGLEYRRAMREISESVSRDRMERDRLIREAAGQGASYRELARAVGLSHGRIQQIVNESPDRAGAGAAR